jgi:hypothetical protein
MNDTVGTVSEDKRAAAMRRHRNGFHSPEQLRSTRHKTDYSLSQSNLQITRAKLQRASRIGARAAPHSANESSPRLRPRSAGIAGAPFADAAGLAIPMEFPVERQPQTAAKAKFEAELKER